MEGKITGTGKLYYKNSTHCLVHTIYVHLINKCNLVLTIS